MPDDPQPRPGPSPTPSPYPVAPIHAIKIGGIEEIQGGAIITPESEWLQPFNVTSEYLQKCVPEVGGFFCQYPDVVSFVSAEEFATYFPQE